MSVNYIFTPTLYNNVSQITIVPRLIARVIYCTYIYMNRVVFRFELSCVHNNYNNNNSNNNNDINMICSPVNHYFFSSHVILCNRFYLLHDDFHPRLLITCYNNLMYLYLPILYRTRRIRNSQCTYYTQVAHNI